MADTSQRLPHAGPSDKLRGNVCPKSGFVIPAGGFFAGNDSKLYALDKDTVFVGSIPTDSYGRLKRTTCCYNSCSSYSTDRITGFPPRRLKCQQNPSSFTKAPGHTVLTVMLSEPEGFCARLSSATGDRFFAGSPIRYSSASPASAGGKSSRSCRNS